MSRRRRHHRGSGSGNDAELPGDLAGLVTAGAAAADGPSTDPAMLEDVVTALIDLAGRGAGHGPDEELARALVAGLHRRWEDGWEPLDVVHVARRRHGHRVARLAATVVTSDAVAGSSAPHVPPGWRRQMDTLAVGTADGAVAAFEAWRQRERIGLPDAVEDGLRLLGLLQRLAPLDPIDGPPSGWASAHLLNDASGDGTHGAGGHADGGNGGAHHKALGTIRALLAKAESTQFPAEADAFTAKAQELMARHAIDAAVVAAQRARPAGAGAASARAKGVRARRVHIEDPLGAEKAQLLGALGDVHEVFVVWDDEVGMATVVGFPVDLDLVELLFTSLLVQATAALARAARAGGERQPPTFRRAFLVAFADRVAERLEDARDRARDEATVIYGNALAPILEARRSVVDEVARELFPHTVAGRARSFDGLGWEAGRTAADAAELHRPGRRDTERARLRP